MFCLELHSSNSLLLQRYKNYLASNKNRIYFVSCQIILLMYFYNFPFTLSSIYNIGSNIAVFRDIILTKNRMMNVVITNKCKIRRIIPRTIFKHYKIFCVNVKYGIQYGFRIFYLIALQNEENYEREESCSA